MFGNNRIKKINYRIKIQKFITTDKNLKENEMNKSLFIDWKAREPRWTPRQRVSNYRLATSTSKEREISLLNSAFNTLLLWCGTTLLIDFPWVAKNSLLFSFQKYFKKKIKFLFLRVDKISNMKKLLKPFSWKWMILIPSGTTSRRAILFRHQGGTMSNNWYCPEVIQHRWIQVVERNHPPRAYPTFKKS